MATDFTALLNNKTRYDGRWMAKSSFANAKLPNDAPIDPNSALYVETLANRGMPTRIQEWPMIKAPGLTLFSWWYSTYTIWVVDRSDPSSYTLEDFQLDRTDGELANMTGLVNAFKQVPVPIDARPCPHYTSPPGTTGHDNNMIIYDPETDRYWETWHTCKVEIDGAHTRLQKWTPNVPQERLDLPGWHAGYGGAMKNMSHAKGYFDNDAWDGTGSGWGASGGKISLATGVITRKEGVDAKNGVVGAIPHILGMGVAAPSWRFWRWPAQTSDGASSDPWAPQYGMIYRLPPDYDVDSVTADPFMTEVLRAIRDYGCIVREYAGNVTFICECGNTRIDEAPLQQTSPTGAPGTYTGVPGYAISLFQDDVWFGEDNTPGPHHDGVFQDLPTRMGEVIPYLDFQVIDASYRPSSPTKSRLIFGTP